MPLRRADLDTDTWARVKADVQAQLVLHMKNLCSTQLSFDDTQAIRGRIAECNRLLALETAPEVVSRRGFAVIPRGATSPEGDSPS